MNYSHVMDLHAVTKNEYHRPVNKGMIAFYVVVGVVITIGIVVTSLWSVEVIAFPVSVTPANGATPDNEKTDDSQQQQQQHDYNVLIVPPI